MTVKEVLALAARDLEAAGVDTPRLDAEVLLAHAMGVDRAALYRDPAADAPERFMDLLARRLRREPVAYIVGERGFRHLSIGVDERVLVPRPETEHVVEVAVDLLPAGARVVDVCTGSGAIALALKHERPDLRVGGTDVSTEALEVARANAARAGLDVEWAQGDLLVPEEVDAVVSNPPYVRDDEELPPEVGFEPSLALRAGPDGLDAYRRLVPRLRGRFVVLEVGEGQARAVAGLLDGWEITVHRDLAGIERVVAGVR